VGLIVLARRSALDVETSKSFSAHACEHVNADSSSSTQNGSSFFLDGAWWGANDSLAAEAAVEEACKWFGAGAKVS